MNIFCKCPTVNISKLNFWLVICFAKNCFRTTLKVIFSIFRFFLHPQIPDFFLWSRVTNNFFENIYHVMKEHLSTVSRIASYNQSFTKINTNDLFLSFLRL